jgi:hypothetical protein
MPYPVFDEYITELEFTTGEQFNAASVSLNEWLSKQHKADGSHREITADSLVVFGNASVGGTLAVTGASTFGTVTLGAVTATSLNVTGASSLVGLVTLGTGIAGPFFVVASTLSSEYIASSHQDFIGDPGWKYGSAIVLKQINTGDTSFSVLNGDISAGTSSNAGSLTLIGSSSSITVNTNKFTVDGATGNTVVAGTLGVTGNLSVNTNKFVVTASTGAVAIAGDMNVAIGHSVAIGDGSSNAGANLLLRGSSSGRNWQLANEIGVSAFTITPSTANGGSAFTTPAMTISDAGAFRWNAYGAGALTTDGSGNITAVSDVRAKKNVTDYTTGMAAIRQVRPIRYHWGDNTDFDQARSYVGFSAQDVWPIVPDAVDTNRQTGQFSLNPFVILAALVNATKQLAARVDALDGTPEPPLTPLVDMAGFEAAIGFDRAKIKADITAKPAVKEVTDDGA